MRRCAWEAPARPRGWPLPALDQVEADTVMTTKGLGQNLDVLTEKTITRVSSYDIVSKQRKEGTIFKEDNF